MASVTTIALLERKHGISRSLFSRYWRDVHGVMAARIPGFDSYTQHHVLPMDDVGSLGVEPFEGIAVVTFAGESDRDGLIHSDITRHIHRDEQNVFRRTLLYNLDADATAVLTDGSADGVADIFLVVPDGGDGAAIAAAVAASGASLVYVYDLTGGDPAGWNDTDVDDGGASRRFAAVIHAVWPDDAAAMAAIRHAVASSGGQAVAYRTERKHVMVEQGRATVVGLRGLDAARTIEEAGAVNQLEPEVTRAIYGAVAG